MSMNSSWRRELLNYSHKPTVFQSVSEPLHTLQRGKRYQWSPQQKHILAEMDLNFILC